jgi:Bacterial Ig-like domain (group 3)
VDILLVAPNGANATILSDVGRGRASLTVPTLGPGTHAITAAYGSDANFLGSTSPALGLAVNDQVTAASSARGIAIGDTFLDFDEVSQPTTKGLPSPPRRHNRHRRHDGQRGATPVIKTKNGRCPPVGRRGFRRPPGRGEEFVHGFDSLPALGVEAVIDHRNGTHHGGPLGSEPRGIPGRLSSPVRGISHLERGNRK